MKYLILLSLFFSPLSHANSIDNHISQKELIQEIRELKRKVSHLEYRVFELENRNLSNHRKVWGCYLDDLSAGGLYATGLTEASAKGKILAKCAEKKGSCWEHKVKCSNSD